jgi:NADH:ubiquinone oxidoreductase subunit 6 (subunit J)
VSVNGIAFYVFAAVALVAALGVVLLPSLRLAAYALAGVGAATALLFLLLGNELLFATQLLVYGLAVPALVLTAVTLVRARGRAGAHAHEAQAEAASRGPFTAWWPIALLTGLGTAALLLGVAAVSTNAWRQGTYPDDATAAQQMGTLIFRTYALPFATSAVLLLTALVGAVVVGRRDDLEEELEEAERERRAREERMRRRREDRERARRAQRPAAVAEAEGQ